MMAPEVYEAARARAPIHVQLWHSGRTRLGRSGRIEGRVVRVFRDHDHRLHWGARVSFGVPMIDRNSSEPPAPSGIIYLDAEWLCRTRWLEAFLEYWDGQFQLIHSQVCPIRHPTLEPVCGPGVKGFVCEGNV